MAIDDFQSLQQPEQALRSHRRAMALSAMRDRYDARFEVLYGTHLSELADVDDEGPAHLEGWGPKFEKAEGKAVALRDLAGLAEADYPWAEMADGDPGATPAPSYQVRLGAAEERLVQARDEQENAAAYHVDPAAAALEVARAEARVLAYREVLEDLRAKVPAAKKKAGGRSSAPTVPPG